MLNQLINFLKTTTTLTILDLRQTLIKNKTVMPEYFLTDFHWNNFGAYLGYIEIMREFSNRNNYIHIYDLNNFNISQITYNLWSGSMLPANYYWKNRQKDIGIKFELKKEMVSDNPQLSTVFVYGDSFAENKFFVNKKLLTEQFPTLLDKLSIFFKNPEDDDLQIKTNIENLIPIIHQNIDNPSLAKNFISFFI